MSSAKLEKVLARQKTKIEEGDYYEAHQQLRTVANRYVKANDYTAAIDILASGANMLLKAGQGGSGADLCIYLMETYNKGDVKPDAASKARLVTLLRAFPHNEPSKKKFVGGVVEWSSKTGEFPAGDPDLHHVIGSLYAQEGEVYEAELHLTLGTSESPAVFSDLEYTWYASSDEPSSAASYAARCVFPYLLIFNTRAANKAFLLFTSALSAAHPNGLGVQSISSPSADIRIYPSLPLLNFIGLLLLACQRGGADLYKQLRAHYAANLKEMPQWEEPLAHIAEKYFGIKLPSAGGGNPMLDMMTNMMMGGNNPFAAARGKKDQGRLGGGGPPAPGVD